MIPKKYEFVIFSFLMSLFMTFIMSFVITLINIGFHDAFFTHWLSVFWRAYIIAFPSVLMVVPVVKKLVKKIVVSS